MTLSQISKYYIQSDGTTLNKCLSTLEIRICDIVLYNHPNLRVLHSIITRTKNKLVFIYIERATLLDSHEYMKIIWHSIRIIRDVMV